MDRANRQEERTLYCQRCHGLLIDDHFIDMGIQKNGRHLLLPTWRCVNCGNILDIRTARAAPGAEAAADRPVKRSKR